jgi:DNA-binding transcriptional MocR family regulator
MVMNFIREGCLEESLTTARLTIASRMKALVKALNRYLPGSSFSVPEGGIYLWLKIPGLDGDRAQDLALSRGISVVSGNRFSWTGKPQEAVRLTVSSVESSSMERVARELRSVWSP